MRRLKDNEILLDPTKVLTALDKIQNDRRRKAEWKDTLLGEKTVRRLRASSQPAKPPFIVLRDTANALAKVAGIPVTDLEASELKPSPPLSVPAIPTVAAAIDFEAVIQTTIEIERSVGRERIDRCIHGDRASASRFFTEQYEFMQLCRSLRLCVPARNKLSNGQRTFSFGSDAFPERVLLRGRLNCQNGSPRITAFQIPPQEAVALPDKWRLPGAVPIYCQWHPCDRIELEAGASLYVDVTLAVFYRDQDVEGLRQQMGREALDVDGLFFLMGSEGIRTLLGAGCAGEGGLPLDLPVRLADGATKAVPVRIQISEVPQWLAHDPSHGVTQIEIALRELHEQADPFYRLRVHMELLRAIWQHETFTRPDSAQQEEALHRIVALAEGYHPGAGARSKPGQSGDAVRPKGLTAIIDPGVLAGLFLEESSAAAVVDLLIMAAEGSFVPILPQWILNEVEGQLLSTVSVPTAAVDEYRRELGRLNGLTGELPLTARPPFSSVSDFLVDLAVAACVDYIVTTDPRLIEERSIHLDWGQGPVIKIASPADLLEMLAS